MKQFALLALLSILPITSADAQSWSRFRGPNGAGVAADPDEGKNIPTTWSAADFNWTVDLPGVGHASPVLWGERLFIASGDETSGERILACLHREDGRTLWTRRFAAAKSSKHSLNSFASTTPVADERQVYFCWGTAAETKVVALDHDGQPRWQIDLGGFHGGHGFGVSPIVHGDLLIVPFEQSRNSALLALDKLTGETRWRVPRNSQVAYSTPCLFSRPGRPDALIFTDWEYGITGLDPTDGATLWAADCFDKAHIKTAIGSPVVHGDLVIGTCGWMGVKQQVIALRIDPEANPPKLTEAWRVERSAPLCTTPLVLGGLAFLWSDDGIVTCLDADSGKLHWRERVGGTYYSSPIGIGDRIFNISTDGHLHVLAASPDYRHLARNDLGEGSHATPALAHGTLYIRTFRKLFSVGGKKP